MFSRSKLGEEKGRGGKGEEKKTTYEDDNRYINGVGKKESLTASPYQGKKKGEREMLNPPATE